MFTGIISELGTLEGFDASSEVVGLRIRAPRTCEGLTIGDSVAVNGVCLTVVDTTGAIFAVEVVPESLARSSLGELEPGGPVNLERPLAATGRYDGHIVQGHVDGVGRVLSISEEGDSTRMQISLPSGLARYVVEKGSIAVDGTSLTVTAVSAAGAAEAWFEVVLIPHTLGTTVFGERMIGDVVNLEVDVIAKYVERMLGEGV